MEATVLHLVLTIVGTLLHPAQKAAKSNKTNSNLFKKSKFVLMSVTLDATATLVIKIRLTIFQW